MVYLAEHGEGPFHKSGPIKNLNVAYNFLPLQFIVLVRQGSEIQNFSDLKKYKSIMNFGIEGSGLNGTIERILQELSFNKSDFLESKENLSAPKQARALCEKKLDVIAYVVSEKSTTISSALNTCPIKLVSFQTNELEKLSTLGYNRAIIQANTYSNQTQPIQTIGLTPQGITLQ